MTDQRLQTEKPMCSDSTEKSRLRPAIARPLAFQKSRSSGRQSSMQRAEVVHPPALRIAPHEQDDQLVEETRALMAARPDVVLVTTGYGVRSGPRGGAGAFADDRARVDRGRGRRAGRTATPTGAWRCSARLHRRDPARAAGRRRGLGADGDAVPVCPAGGGRPAELAASTRPPRPFSRGDHPPTVPVKRQARARGGSKGFCLKRSGA
jgi:hypothetical protein